ncbi:MAG: hypothetical protein AABX04_00465 [Nanoarchaeota archaeon]
MVTLRNCLINAAAVVGTYLLLTAVEYTFCVSAAKREMIAWEAGKPEASFSKVLDRLGEAEYVSNSFNPLYRLTHSRTEETQKNKDRMAQEALSVALSGYVK